MHDIKAIRENPQGFDAGLARRGVVAAAGKILQVDAERRMAVQHAEVGQARRKVLSQYFGTLKAKGDAIPPELTAELESLKNAPASDDQNVALLTATLDLMLKGEPNLPANDVPDGAEETDNIIVHERGTVPVFNFQPSDHADFATRLGLDFESAQAVSGARFAYLRGDIARLSRGLGQFMLDVHITESGYQEVTPPLLVRSDAMYGTGQLPKFADDSFETTDGRWLIPTAEVSLTNLVREQILSEEELPLRFVALTPCFRSEAGAAGKDTRGLIRQHQFDKVELVSITTPETSDGERGRIDRKSTRLNSSHRNTSRMPSSA